MTNQQGAPEALRPITRYEVVDCIDSKHVPAVIPNGAGPWVRYEDHLAALVEAQQPAKAEGFREGAAEMAKLRGQRMVLCSLLGECLPVIDALMQIPGDDASDARLNGLAGRITGALNALAEDQVKGGES